MSHQILIVDDDTDFRDELSDYLNNYRILEASNGDEALRLIKKSHAIDLVILDVVMPGTNGIEILKEMKRIVPDLNIIILTGQSSRDVIVDALRGHADDFFEKPVDIKGLDASIQKILDSKEGSPSRLVAGKNHKIERAKRFLERNDDKMVHLQDIAAEVCMSPKYFSRIFKEDTGIGFNDYKLKVRTQKAKTLLEKTAYTIQQIAEKIGYKNLESFIRLFKKTTGMTPAAYRRRQSNKTRKRK